MIQDYFATGATVFAAAIFVGWIVSWIIHIISILFGLHHLYKKLDPVIPEEELPGVSILKPLTGVDINLKSNLETFFTQKYPKYELLFSVQDDNDPAILVVKSLIDSYPKVDAKLFIGLKVVGPNGKINNMVRSYEAAKYDNIVISDTSIKMTPSTLYEMVHCLKPHVGLVLQMPYCATRKGFGAIYQQVYFGTMQARNCLSANAVNINCSTGMSSLLRRDVLDKAGGLAEFGKYLAEDFFIAEAIRSQGYKVVLSTTPALQNSGNSSITDFHSRLIRWSQLRISMVPTLIVLEPVGESVLLGVFVSWAAMTLFDVSPLGFFMGHFLVWFLSDYILFRIVENGPLPFSKFEFLVAWLMRELLSPYIILSAHLQNHVVWRNQKYKLHWGGKVVVPVTSSLDAVAVS
ncbi:ceramide glucosyltransferase-B [Biomphalaria glabrata]|uniref:ceramide glucosyltransferase n=1 Tax=Biomphalaria glabrata TaxID=6526 RepID=A0A9W2YGX5_BIOGL|nr:ceramide glucosyltransferase-like [Biomphalaria glabrata]KAI8728497.1 ceramide glucosyltransferase-B-like; partial [Biomphalaria glabrata]